MSDSNGELFFLIPIPGEMDPEDNDSGVFLLEEPCGGRSPEAEGVGSRDMRGGRGTCWVLVVLEERYIPLTSRDVMSMLSRLVMELRGFDVMKVMAAAWSSRTAWVCLGDNSDGGGSGDGRGSSLS